MNDQQAAAARKRGRPRTRNFHLDRTVLDRLRGQLTLNEIARRAALSEAQVTNSGPVTLKVLTRISWALGVEADVLMGSTPPPAATEERDLGPLLRAVLGELREIRKGVDRLNSKLTEQKPLAAVASVHALPKLPDWRKGAGR